LKRRCRQADLTPGPSPKGEGSWCPTEQLIFTANFLEMSSKYDDKLFKGATASTFENARNLRKVLTNAEESLWQELRNRKLQGLKFRRQHPISHYIADFYCAEKRLVVEVDGCIHNSKEQKEYDERRTADLASMGIHVLRFTNNEVEQDMPSVLKRIDELTNNDEFLKS
jgi:very-short-patch-repair endonuclease